MKHYGRVLADLKRANGNVRSCHGSNRNYSAALSNYMDKMQTLGVAPTEMSSLSEDFELSTNKEPVTKKESQYLKG